MPPDQRTLDQLSLSREEYDRIIDLLDREPNEVELGMFGAMWCEHCGYKNSRPLLKTLPQRRARASSPRRGEENAGVVDIGDGLRRRVQDRVAQPPVGDRAVRGRGDRRRRHRARHLRHGRAADRAARLAALRAAAADDAASAAGTPRRSPRRREGGAQPALSAASSPASAATATASASRRSAARCRFSPSYNGNPLVNAMCVGIGAHRQAA